MANTVLSLSIVGGIAALALATFLQPTAYHAGYTAAPAVTAAIR